MAKTPSKGTVAIQRLLEERRQLESWIARIDAAADATPAAVRGRVRSDYETRLITVIKELKNHMEAAREVIAQRRQVLKDLQEKEADAAEALSEAELRHAVVEKLQEIDALATEASPAPKPAPKPAPPPVAEPSLTVVSDRGKNTSPPATRPPSKAEEKKHEPVDELAFLKSVTEDARGGGVSPRRASGAQYQPAEPGNPPSPPEPPAQPPMATRAPRITQESDPVIAQSGEEPVKTLKCRDCGTMNLP